jgi:hypothetical protein
MSGMAFGSWFAGALYDHFGYYAPAFASGATFNIANLAIIAFLLLRQQWTGGCLVSFSVLSKLFYEISSRKLIVQRLQLGRHHFPNPAFRIFSSSEIQVIDESQIYRRHKLFIAGFIGLFRQAKANAKHFLIAIVDRSLGALCHHPDFKVQQPFLLIYLVPQLRQRILDEFEKLAPVHPLSQAGARPPMSVSGCAASLPPTGSRGRAGRGSGSRSGP